MLDVCGIETGHRPTSAGVPGQVAIDARWLWNGGHVAFYGPVARTEVSRSMLDGCGIETCSDPLGLYPGGFRSNRCSMAVESRLLLAERRTTVVLEVAIDARWLWNRDLAGDLGQERLRSVFVAIDARWLWNRDMNRWQTYNRRDRGRRDRCSMAVESRPRARRSVHGLRVLGRRDRCSMAVESRLSASDVSSASASTGRDRCSMAVESRQ